MRTNATSVTTVVTHLADSERFQYPLNGGVLVVHEVGYALGQTHFVGRIYLKGGALSKRTHAAWNVPASRVPEEIATAIRGAVRAHVGEQARALGLL